MEISDDDSLISQEEGGWGRKLPCNQKLELIFSRVAPDLVSKSAGLSATDNAEISMILVPQNKGSPAESFLAIILSTISESPMNMGSDSVMLDSSRVIFLGISDFGAE